MVAPNTDFAASKPDTDPKNRVGRFFSLAAETVGEDSRSSRKCAGEKRGYGYDIASVDTEFEYGAFGELIRATGEKKEDFNFRFSTKYEDTETGLLYYGYRYYNAETGRWLNRDPIGELGGLNLYRFIGNDGINAIDFYGLQKIKVNGEVWQTPLRSDFDHPHKLPSGGDAGPHMHGPNGKKYFPQHNMILDKNGKWEDAGNKFRKDFKKSIKCQLRGGRGGNALGIIGTAFLIGELASSDASAEQLKSYYQQYQSAYVSGDTTSQEFLAIEIAAWVQNHGGTSLGGAHVLTNLLPGGNNSSSQEQSSIQSPSSVTPSSRIIAETSNRRKYSDGRVEVKINGQWVPKEQSQTGAWKD